MDVMRAAHAASGADMVTVAIRRINLDDASGKTMLDYIDRAHMRILPNTAGCYSVKDALLTAQLARELLETDLIKLEVIGDRGYALSRSARNARSCGEARQPTVSPYCRTSATIRWSCKQLEEVGCAAVMPLAAPIGSGLGVCNPYSIRIIVENAPTFR